MGIPSWTRSSVLARAGGKCELCEQRLPLQLHHKHYETRGHESPDDLLAICDGCHRSRHYDADGVFFSADELSERITAFDEACEKD